MRPSMVGIELQPFGGANEISASCHVFINFLFNYH